MKNLLLGLAGLVLATSAVVLSTADDASAALCCRPAYENTPLASGCKRACAQGSVSCASSATSAAAPANCFISPGTCSIVIPGAHIQRHKWACNCQVCEMPGGAGGGLECVVGSCTNSGDPVAVGDCDANTIHCTDPWPDDPPGWQY